MMTSNIAECINGCLVEARQLTILEFLEEVRILFGSLHFKNREVSSYTKDTLGRKFEELLIINAAKSSKMEVCIIIWYFILYISNSVYHYAFFNMIWFLKVIYLKFLMYTGCSIIWVYFLGLWKWKKIYCLSWAESMLLW